MTEKFLLVASDIHSGVDSFEYLSKIAEDENCLAFLYAGDLDVENYFIGNILRNRNFLFLPVLGNCDSPYSFQDSGLPMPSLYRCCTYNELRIFITHGHMYGKPSDVGFNDADFDIVVSGHTHIPQYISEAGLEYLNPGSAERPRGYSEKSYAKIVFTGQKHQVLFEKIPDQSSH